MQVSEVAIEKVIPYARNPRKNTAAIAKVAASIKEFGFRQPVVVDDDNVVIAGHTRLEAARTLGMDKVPVHVAKGLTEAQVKAYRLADNRVSQEAEWDLDLLKLEMGDLDGLGFDLDLTGFDPLEIDGLLVEETEGLTDEDAVPEVPDDPVTKLGDVWLLGNHRLMCGDSTSIDAVDKLMGKQTASCVVTDPPYNQETEGGFKGEIGWSKSLKKQSADIESMCDFNPDELLGILPVVFLKSKMNATIFCNKDLVPAYLNWASEAGYSFNILIWKKPNAIPLGGSYQPDVEYMLVIRKSATFNTKVEGVKYSKVLAFDRENGLHPTMKPVGLLENQIKIVSNPGETVADLFGGSGSTMIACEKTGRECYMMELDPKHCDVIIRRWQDFTGKQATLDGGGEFFPIIKADAA